MRQDIELYGSFVEVYMATPLHVCEKRDRKGLYRLARSGALKEFTGISDPYEIPVKPELVLNSEVLSVKSCAFQIIKKLKELGLL